MNVLSLTVQYLDIISLIAGLEQDFWASIIDTALTHLRPSMLHLAAAVLLRLVFSGPT